MPCPGRGQSLDSLGSSHPDLHIQLFTTALGIGSECHELGSVPWANNDTCVSSGAQATALESELVTGESRMSSCAEEREPPASKGPATGATRPQVHLQRARALPPLGPPKDTASEDGCSGGAITSMAFGDGNSCSLRASESKMNFTGEAKGFLKNTKQNKTREMKRSGSERADVFVCCVDCTSKPS